MPNATGYVRAKVSIICVDCGTSHDVDRRNAPGTTRCPPCARKHGWTIRVRKVTYPSCPLVLRICTYCAKTYTRKTGGTRYCSKACSHEAQMLKQGCRNRPCKACGTFLGYKSLVDYCEACRAERRSEYRLRDRANRPAGMKNHDSRARYFGVPRERIDRSKVYDRDGWTCGICGSAIPQEAQYPHPLSVSLDHVIPLSRGGGHLYANVQASHLECNVLKGARIGV